MRTRSERSPEPTCSLRARARSRARRSRSASYRRERIQVSARALFDIWLRSSWHSTAMPEGLCRMRMADSVLLTCWPPAPPDFWVVISRSAGLITTSASSASGRTATVAAEVCTRPAFSVSGTRCTRWPPASKRSRPYAPRPPGVFPVTWNEISLNPPFSPSATISGVSLRPLRPPHMVYMRAKSPANSAASSPPVPARISMIALRPLVWSLVTSRPLMDSISWAWATSAAAISSRAMARISGSASKSVAAMRLSSSFTHSANGPMTRPKRP